MSILAEEIRIEFVNLFRKSKLCHIEIFGLWSCKGGGIVNHLLQRSTTLILAAK